MISPFRYIYDNFADNKLPIKEGVNVTSIVKSHGLHKKIIPEDWKSRYLYKITPSFDMGFDISKALRTNEPLNFRLYAFGMTIDDALNTVWREKYEEYKYYLHKKNNPDLIID